MRTYLDCIPCLMNQTLRAARLATDDEKTIKAILDRVGSLVKEIPMGDPPPKTARRVYRIIEESTGNPDPYHELKIRNTQTALELYPALKEKIRRSGDPLLTAIRLAIAGNVIDFGINERVDIQKEIDQKMKQTLVISDYDAFKASLASCDEILYIGDNAGESVFDRILIEEINKPVEYTVRSAPVINDVTHADALQAGLDQVAKVIPSGADSPGVVLELCSPKFRDRFNRSKMIISKGQGNFEALSDVNAPVFFLLIAKCPIIARDIGVSVGDMILARATPTPQSYG
jgi:uncharacterized protein with ATP-grasp and redox domains